MWAGDPYPTTNIPFLAPWALKWNGIVSRKEYKLYNMQKSFELVTGSLFLKFSLFQADKYLLHLVTRWEKLLFCSSTDQIDESNAGALLLYGKQH